MDHLSLTIIGELSFIFVSYLSIYSTGTKQELIQKIIYVHILYSLYIIKYLTEFIVPIDHQLLLVFPVKKSV